MEPGSVSRVTSSPGVQRTPSGTRRAAGVPVHASQVTGTSSPFVTVVKDARGVWWFERAGHRFLSQGISNVNDGGGDDGPVN